MQNVETNDRYFFQRRMKDMYKRLGGPDDSLISPLILRPIAYLVAEEMKRMRQGTGRYLLEERMQSSSLRVLSSYMGI